MKWKSWTNEMGISAVGPDGKNPVCKVYQGEHLNLIAAAPELLSALEWAVDQIEDSLDFDHQDALEGCKAAIAKARGAE